MIKTTWLCPNYGARSFSVDAAEIAICHVCGQPHPLHASLSPKVSLRDQIAIEGMKLIMARYNSKAPEAEIAREAYGIADAMIAERQKNAPV